MTFRCEICDDWLPMFQFSKLCPTCYKIRTITKCYSAKEILETLEDNFLVSVAMEHEKRAEDVKFYEKEDKRLGEEALKDFNPTEEQLAKLEEQAKKIIEAQEKAKEVVKGAWDNAPLEKEYPQHYGKATKEVDILPKIIESERPKRCKGKK